MAEPAGDSERKWWQGGLEFQKARENMGQISLTPDQADVVLRLKEHADRAGKPFNDFLTDLGIGPKLAKKLNNLLPESKSKNVKVQKGDHDHKGGGFANSGISGWYRLLIVFSILWMILIYAGMEPWEYSDRQKDFVLIGILPVTVFWGAIWVAKGFRRKKPARS